MTIGVHHLKKENLFSYKKKIYQSLDFKVFCAFLIHNRVVLYLELFPLVLHTFLSLKFFLLSAAHTTQFTSIGWSYFSHGNGVGKLPKGGSYVSLTNEAKDQLTLVIETMVRTAHLSTLYFVVVISKIILHKSLFILFFWKLDYVIVLS